MIYLQLFYTFFKIGLFGFGGGYAMLSMIQGEVVTRYGWVTSQEFTDIVAISQMTPGPIGINAATYVGFTSTGSVWGSIVATFAVVFPSFILMLTISKFFLKYQKHPVVESICRTASGSCRIIGFRRTGIDEYGKFLFTQRRHLLFYHQHHHLPGNLYRHQKIQDQSDINDNCLRNCRSIILLNDE